MGNVASRNNPRMVRKTAHAPLELMTCHVKFSFRNLAGIALRGEMDCLLPACAAIFWGVTFFLPFLAAIASRIRGFPWLGLLVLSVAPSMADEIHLSQTAVSIVGDDFYINGRPTYEKRQWRGHNLAGLLLNSRMVQGIFDDRNEATAKRWVYPDTAKWDPERNTREFLEAMPAWRERGLLAFTLNLQGGSPEGYSKEQPWHNSGIEADGSLRADYLARLERLLDRADDLGMVVIVGYFYFGQDERLRDEKAVLSAADQLTDWILSHGYRHVLVEINNECNVRYDHAILQPDRVHELIERVRNTTKNGRRLYVGTSYGGGTIPGEKVARSSDFILLHGNGVSDPAGITEMIRKTRALPTYWAKPILFNEDDHFDFAKPLNNFVATVSAHVSWGYFDPGKNNYEEGYQSPPVRWGINTERKQAFFKLVAEMTGSPAAEHVTAAPAIVPTDPGQSGSVHIALTNYHGWNESIVMANGQAEVIIVPAVGRVMQFKFAGEEGPFWENRELDGKPPDPLAKEWGNFGGDKTWPSPQSEWPQYTGRGWPPPPAFDSMPVRTELKKNTVRLISAVDPQYGIRTVRDIELDPKLPVLTIVTTYEKVEGPARKAGIWVITQLKNPACVYVPLPRPSLYRNGYNKQSDDLPAQLQVVPGWLSLKRDSKKSTKIGMDAGTMLWVGEKSMVRIDSPRQPGAEYPDQGSSAEIYTNPDPLPYVELETLGPLFNLEVGSKITQSNNYTLIRRSDPDPEKDARRALRE